MKLYIIVLFALLLAACSKKSDVSLNPNDRETLTPELCVNCYPPCVRDVITNGSKEWIEIHQYTWNGQTVYLFIHDCCDFYDVLVDAYCNVLCAPSGGFSGGGDGQCPDFYNQATFIKIVWKR